MIEYGNWSPATEAELKTLRARMLTLATPIKEARNRILSHNDLAVILQSKILGHFESGQEEEYFERLREFASIVRGGTFVYDDLVRNDVEIFLECFNRGLETV